LPVIKLLTIAIYSDIASFIAKQLEEIGFNIQVEVVQKSLLLEQTAKSQAGFFRGSWIADYPDAENYMAMFYSKNPAFINNCFAFVGLNVYPFTSSALCDGSPLGTKPASAGIPIELRIYNINCCLLMA